MFVMIFVDFRINLSNCWYMLMTVTFLDLFCIQLVSNFKVLNQVIAIFIFFGLIILFLRCWLVVIQISLMNISHMAMYVWVADSLKRKISNQVMKVFHVITFLHTGHGRLILQNANLTSEDEET